MPKMKSRKFLPWCLCTITVSVISIIGGFVIAFIWPVIFRTIVESNFVLKPHLHAYDLWKKFPVVIPLKFYFFNWTNPEEIYNVSSKPRFQQIGPYVFDETREKDNLVWNDNGTVTFKHRRTWFYKNDPENGNLHDPLVTLNPISVSAAYSARTWSYFMRKGLSVTLLGVAPTVHITKTVREMLFDGYRDPLIKLARNFPSLAGSSLPPWDKFAWFYTRNGSADYEGVYNMGTGIGTTFGKLYAWNYGSKTQYYSDHCAMVNGSAGELFPRFPPKDTISFFSPDLCRSLTLTYVGETAVDNILGNKYVLDDLSLDNGTLYPENSCFCDGECLPSGVMNVSKCRFGSPGFASLPHFYNADPYYINAVEGIKPEEKRHEFYIILERVTGLPLEVSARLQINLLMQPIPGIGVFENVPRMLFPMLWFDETVKIPENEAFKLKLLLSLPIICSSIGVLLVFIGLIILSCFIYKICTNNICGKKKKQQVYQETIPLKAEPNAEIIFRKP